jgi:hypothetical protein
MGWSLASHFNQVSSCSAHDQFRRVEMPEQVPNSTPLSQKPSEPPLDDFEQTLKGLYGNVEWSQEAKDYLRETGLI